MDGAAIKQVRSQLELSQAELATILGVHWVTVSKWERAVLAPDPYREALLVRFEEAAGKQEFGDTIARALLGRGVAAALFLLLKAAFENEPEDSTEKRGSRTRRGTSPTGRAARARGGRP